MTDRCSSTIVGYSDQAQHCPPLPLTGLQIGLLIAIAIVFIVVGLVLRKLGKQIFDDYGEDREALYSDTLLPKETDDPDVP